MALGLVLRRRRSAVDSSTDEVWLRKPQTTVFSSFAVLDLFFGSDLYILNVFDLAARTAGEVGPVALSTVFKTAFWSGPYVPDGVLDENDEGEKRVRHVTVNVEGRNILRKHEDVRLVRLLKVGLHPLIVRQKRKIVLSC